MGSWIEERRRLKKNEEEEGSKGGKTFWDPNSNTELLAFFGFEAAESSSVNFVV